MHGLMSAGFWMWVVAAVLVLAGLAGTVMPALPGVPLVFAGLVIAAWAGDFARVTWLTVSVLAGLTALSFVIEFAATAMGARRVGASGLAIAGATVGTVAGIFFGIPGIILGPFVGAVAGELIAQGGLEQAARAGLATWVGLVLGTAAKLAIAFAMVGIFALAWLV
ncbi:MAG TPA: DUF456 domain-containing protein [Candidatus Binatia bacterium]|nr:DUF456 domain-containing protein [Candidatus Binatia bacterium]